MPECAGTTQGLAKILESPVNTIADVAERLGQVHDYALTTTTAGEADGIVCFSGLYRTITQTIDVTPYEDRDFLVRLDLEFARRYFDAIRAYATERHFRTPAVANALRRPQPPRHRAGAVRRGGRERAHQLRPRGRAA